MPTIFFVGAGAGDPELITVKGHRLVRDADVLLYTGSLVNPELIEQSHAPLRESSWGMKLEDQISFMTEHARAGKNVVRLHTGDPSLYGAIAEQIVELEKRGIDVEIIPGVSSLFGAAASLKAELTPKGVSESVIITRPAGNTLETDQIRELSRHGATMAIFLGAGHFDDVTSCVEYPPDTPAAVVYHATWKDEQILRGTIATIAQQAREAGIEKTALLIIGRAVDPRYGGLVRSHLYS